MIERLLKSWTRVPLIVEWDFLLIVDSATGLAPSARGRDTASRSWPVLAQQVGSYVEADLQLEAPVDFVLHTVGSPARLVGWGINDPLGDLDGLCLIERAPLPVEGSFKAALSTSLEPGVEGARHDACGFGRQFDRHTLAHISKGQQPGATVREVVHGRAVLATDRRFPEDSRSRRATSRRVTVTGILRELLACKFPEKSGGFS